MPVVSHSYFANFPQIEYCNVTVTNIMIRSKIIEDLKNSVEAFLPYTIAHDERPEDVAFNYYDDPNLVWLVFLSNDTLDPHYDWPLPRDAFDRFVTEKYGSIVTAQTTTHHYKLTADDSIIISPDSFSYQAEQGDWTLVDAYEFEDEKNENNRNIFLLNKKHINLALNNLRDTLNK